MLAAEAASTIKLKNGNDDGVVMDGSSLEDVIAGIGARAKDGNSSVVGMSDNHADYDVSRRSPAGPLF